MIGSGGESEYVDQVEEWDLQCYDLRRELKEGHCYSIDCAVARVGTLWSKEMMYDGALWNLCKIAHDALTGRKCQCPVVSQG